MRNQEVGRIAASSDRAASPSDLSHSSVASRSGIPCAGAVFEIVYPFVRGTYDDPNNDFAETATWRPGVAYKEVFTPPDGLDSYPHAEAEGRARFTVEATFKPGRFPVRVFFTRKFIDPDGREFGKSKLHITTLEAFRRLVLGFRFPYAVGNQPCPDEYWTGYAVRDARARFEELLAASAMSASGQDAEERLEAKPASAVPEGETPQ